MDRSRPDPYLPAQPYRELAVSITYPAEEAPGCGRAGWLTPGLAPHAAERYDRLVPDRPGAVDWGGIRTHAWTGAPVKAVDGGWPVLVRPLEHYGSATHIRIAAAEMASRGYVVVASEPTYETPVRFPDGRMVPASPATDPPADFDGLISFVREKVYGSRVADARFVLDRLPSIGSGGLGRAVDLRRVGTFGGGWSAGSMSLKLMHDDPRVRAAFVGDTAVSHADASGRRAPWVTAVRVDRPVFVMRPGLPDEDPFWDDQWRHLRGWRRETSLAGAGTFSFLDLQALLPRIRSGLGLPARTYVPYVGTIRRASLRAQFAYMAAFFGEHLSGRGSPLLDGPSPRHPAVRFTRR